MQLLEERDFFTDQLLVRQVKRAAREAAGELDEDDDDLEDNRPRGTQRNRPEPVDDYDDVVSDEERRQTIARVKREMSSHGPSLTHGRTRDISSPEPDEDEIVAVDSPEPDEDEIEAVYME